MTRAVAPVLGTVFLVALTVTIAAAAGTSVLAAPLPLTGSSPVALSASADAATDELVLVHESGRSVDLRTARLAIEVDGAPLAHQPPIPFFAANGFIPGPTGPFNSATDSVWEAGEIASLQLAQENRPQFRSGATVTVRLYHDDRLVARVMATAN